MSCMFYNNNNCSCEGCIHFIKSTSVELNGDKLTIIIPSMELKNHQHICLCIVQTLPKDIPIDTTINICIGNKCGTKLIPITNLGNYIYADAIKSRKLYPFIIATDSKFIVLQNLCKLNKTKTEFPVIPISNKPDFFNKK